MLLFLLLHIISLMYISSEILYEGIPTTTSVNWNVLESLDGIRWSGRNGIYLY